MALLPLVCAVIRYSLLFGPSVRQFGRSDRSSLLLRRRSSGSLNTSTVRFFGSRNAPPFVSCWTSSAMEPGGSSPSSPQDTYGSQFDLSVLEMVGNAALVEYKVGSV